MAPAAVATFLPLPPPTWWPSTPPRMAPATAPTPLLSPPERTVDTLVITPQVAQVVYRALALKLNTLRASS